MQSTTRRRHFGLISAAVLLALIAAEPASAEVVFDDSTPRPGDARQSGPTFFIDANRGWLRAGGKLLFHSFSEFDIGSSEQARFLPARLLGYSLTTRWSRSSLMSSSAMGK